MRIQKKKNKIKSKKKKKKKSSQRRWSQRMDEMNKAGYTASSCGRVGRGGNARFPIFRLVGYGLMDGRTDGRTDGETDRRKDGRTKPLIELRVRN